MYGTLVLNRIKTFLIQVYEKKYLEDKYKICELLECL